MKYIITSIILSIVCAAAMAQTNILEQLHVEKSMWYTFIEKGNNYYVLNEVEGGMPDASNRKPRIFFLNKYDKQSSNLVASVPVAGDTLHSDSILISFPMMLNRDDKFYILYGKKRTNGNPYEEINYFVQADTALNITAPEKYLTSYGLILGGTAVQDNGHCIIGYHTSSATSVGSSKYLLLDSMGNILADDSLGTPESRPVTLRQMVNLPENKFLVSGNMMSGNATPEQQFGWTISDSNMTILDTFLYKKAWIKVGSLLPSV